VKVEKGKMAKLNAHLDECLQPTTDGFSANGRPSHNFTKLLWLHQKIDHGCDQSNRYGQMQPIPLFDMIYRSLCDFSQMKTKKCESTFTKSLARLFIKTFKQFQELRHGVILSSHVGEQ